MFALSFSFIFFITSVSEMESKNLSTNLKFQYGSDLVLINQGLESDVDAVTLDMVQELNSIQGIDQTALIMYNMFDITAIMSVIFDFGDSGPSFDEDSINDAFLNIFAFYSAQAVTKFQVTAAALVIFAATEARLIGLQDDYYSVMEQVLMHWCFP